MALNACPECANEVSDQAPACPHCGYTLQPSADPLDGHGAPLSRGWQEWLLVGSVVGIIIGSFLPWVTATAPFVGRITLSGMDGGDGIITLVGGVVLGLYAFQWFAQRSLRSRMFPLATVIALGAVVWLAFTDVKDRVDLINADEFGSAGYGSGLMLLGVALVLAAVALLSADVARKPAKSIEDA